MYAGQGADSLFLLVLSGTERLEELLKSMKNLSSTKIFEAK